MATVWSYWRHWTGFPKFVCFTGSSQLQFLTRLLSMMGATQKTVSLKVQARIHCLFYFFVFKAFHVDFWSLTRVLVEHVFGLDV